MYRFFLFLLVGVSLLSALSTDSVLAAIACPPNYSDTTGAGVCIPDQTGLSAASVSYLLEVLLKWLLGFVGILGVLAFVISGFQYLTAAGDEDQAKVAKRNITYAIIGVVVALSGLIVITAIDSIFKGTASFN